MNIRLIPILLLGAAVFGTSYATNVFNFSNTNQINLLDGSVASPYPSVIPVSFTVPGGEQVTQVVVTLNGFGHTFPSDVTALLVGPTGQTCILLRANGGAIAVSNLSIALSSAAALALPSPLVNGTFLSNAVAAGNLPAPAPVGPYGTTLTLFNSLDPNGNWNLYIADGGAPDAGLITNGWSLQITTAPAVVLTANAPVVLKQQYATTLNTALVVPVGTGVLNGATNASANGLIAAVVRQPNNGTLTLNADGSFTYTPANGFTGIDSFDFKGINGLDSAVRTAYITVNSSTSFSFLNINPITINSNTTATPYPLPLAVSIPALLTSNYQVTKVRAYINNLTMGTLSSTSNVLGVGILLLGPTNQTTLLMGQGSASQAPVPGTDIIFDDAAANRISTTLLSGTFRPTTQYASANYFAPIVSPFTLVPFYPYGKSLSLMNGVNPNGTWNLYVQNFAAGNTGTINDGWGLTIEIAEIGQLPTALDKQYQVLANVPLTIPAVDGILAGDENPNQGTLTASLVTNAANGTLALNQNDGSFLYTPNSGFVGTDSFTYQAIPGGNTNLASNVATIFLHVNADTERVKFYNSSLIRTTANNSPATPYPSIITVTNIPTDLSVSNVRVYINGLSKKSGAGIDTNNASFIRMLLVGPQGQNVFLTSAGFGRPQINTLYPIDVVFDQEAPIYLPEGCVVSGHYKPLFAYEQLLPIFSFPAPAPSQAINNLYGDTLALFNNVNPNGQWRLFVFDASTGGAAIPVNIQFGWALEFDLEQRPVGATQNYVLAQNTTLNVSAPGLLSGASGEPKSVLTAQLRSNPANGTLVSFNPNGSFSYQPNLNYVGNDSFTFAITDSVATSVVYTVNLTIQ